MIKKLFAKLIYSEKPGKSNWSEAIEQMNISKRERDEIVAEAKAKGERELAENRKKEYRSPDIKEAA